MNASQRRFLFLMALLLCLITTAMRSSIPRQPPGPLTIATKGRIGGHNGQNSAQDIDFYPAIAYAPLRNQYLTVWLSANRAETASAGLDLYARFLDQQGNPQGNAFLISDQNRVARNGPPTVVSTGDGFIVVWTVTGDHCALYMQYIIDDSAKTDQLLSSGDEHRHSPALLYDPVSQQGILAMVSGADYLPPTMMGAATSDCDDQAGSTAKVLVQSFHLNGDIPQTDQTVTLTPGSAAALRPAIAHHSGMGVYLVAWEDRRSAGSAPYRFDLYAQLLATDSNAPATARLTVNGSNFSLAEGADYTNLNTSAHWTPRPALAAGATQFFATWFEKASGGNFPEWRVMGRLLTSATTISPPLTVMQTLYTGAHPNDAPQGYLRTIYLSGPDEYLVAMTAHRETFFGYFATLQLQRVLATGTLVTLQGEAQNSPGNGTGVDNAIEQQLSLGMAERGVDANNAEVVMLYGKHAANGGAQDFDIWGARLVASTASTPTPTLPQTPTPTGTATPTGAAPSATPTVTITPPDAVPVATTAFYLPLITRH